MSPYFIQFIANYGYFAMFGIIILQELGVPIPMFNEVFLMFFGYLAFTRVANLPLVILITFAASFLGAWILYGLFYTIMQRFLSWLPTTWLGKKLPFIGRGVENFEGLIEGLAVKVSKRGAFWGIFIGRNTPFGRGYVCIAAGLMKVKPRTYLEATLISDILWNAFWVSLGFILGPNWEMASHKVGGLENLGLVLLGAFVAFLVGKFIYGKYKERQFEKTRVV